MCSAIVFFAFNSPELGAIYSPTAGGVSATQAIPSHQKILIFFADSTSNDGQKRLFEDSIAPVGVEQAKLRHVPAIRAAFALRDSKLHRETNGQRNHWSPRELSGCARLGFPFFEC